MYDGQIDLGEENNARSKVVRLIEPGSRFDQAALSHCIAMALTFHADKRRPAA